MESSFFQASGCNGEATSRKAAASTRRDSQDRHSCSSGARHNGDGWLMGSSRLLEITLADYALIFDYNTVTASHHTVQETDTGLQEPHEAVIVKLGGMYPKHLSYS